jgi:hypothetical protein
MQLNSLERRRALPAGSGMDSVRPLAMNPCIAN